MNNLVIQVFIVAISGLAIAVATVAITVQPSIAEVGKLFSPNHKYKLI